MEPTKISVEVRVSLSENTQKFIESLFRTAAPSCDCASVSDTKVPASAPAAKVPAAKVPAAAAPAPAPAPAAKSSIDIETLRTALSAKVNAHRAEIKAKLTELGAPSVTKLDPGKYQELYDYLTALA